MGQTFTISAACVAFGLCLVGAGPASAGDFPAQLATAATHAGMAAAAGDLNSTRSHLQHVINCLAGPAGEGFDPAQANPCKDLGFGAIPDASMDKMPALQAAARLAGEAKAEPDGGRARDKAASVQAALSKIAR